MMHLRLMSAVNRKIGFTLVEMLVYLAIFMILSVGAVAFLFSLKDLVGQYRLETMLYRSGTSVLEQVLLAVRQADQVDLLNTTEDDPANGRLTVENAATTTSFTFAAGELELAVNGEDLGSLTLDTVTVDSFTVHHYPLAGDREFVRVQLVLTGTINGTQSKSITLYGGAVVRGAI